MATLDHSEPSASGSALTPEARSAEGSDGTHEAVLRKLDELKRMVMARKADEAALKMYRGLVEE